MAFHFALETLLHFRRSLEHQQELRLRAANQQVARFRHSLEQISLHIRQSQVELEQHLASSTTAAELRFSLAVHTTLQSQRAGLERELSHVITLRDEQQHLYQQARQQREIFQNLRDQQLHAYERDQRRSEQRRLDDTFLLRQAYLRRGPKLPG